MFSDFSKEVLAVEVSTGTKEFFEKNKNLAGVKNAKFKETSAEEALGEIEQADLLIVDPPRAGLSKEVVKKILKEKPKMIVYISCNPKTQAMDFAWLKKDYKIVFKRAYNSFPLTPHFESVLVLERV